MTTMDALEAALAEVRARRFLKIEQRDLLNTEIAQLNATEIGLENTLGYQRPAQIEWTNLVRTVLASVPDRALSAVEVRDLLVRWGYLFAGIKNPLALLNTILQRLSAQGEIERSDAGRPFRFRMAKIALLESRGDAPALLAR